MTETVETKYPARFCLLATADDEQGIEEAKAYVKQHGFTSEDVKIVRDDDAILVVTKREVTLK